MKVVFVAPHPDDIELFAGGAAIKHSMDGDETVEILLTRGELGAVSSWVSKPKRKSLADQRFREAREGASILGMSKLVCLRLEDRKVGLSEEADELIRKAVGAENPELIYAPDPEFTYYKHPDHLATGRIVKGSFEGVPIRFSHTTKPNIEIDIRDVFGQKMRAIKAHRSQRFILLCFRLFWSRKFYGQERKKVERFRFRKAE